MDKNEVSRLFSKYIHDYNIPFLKIRNNNNKKGHYSFDIENNTVSLNFDKSDENDIKNAVMQYRCYASIPIRAYDHLFTFIKVLGAYKLIDVKHPEDELECDLKIDRKFINNMLIANGYEEGTIEV